MHGGVVALAALTMCAAAALVVAAFVQGDTTTALLGRGDSTRWAVGLPEAKWGGAGNQESLTDNFGATNMKISSIIDDIKSVKSHPNFAAAIHSLKAATSESTTDFNTFTSDLNPIGSEKFLPAMPDPEAVVHRMQGLRKTSRYCRLNPSACKTLAPEWVAKRADLGPVAEEEEGKDSAADAGAMQQLASTSGSTFAGRGDSLLPHGPLWGLKDKNAVRYHEYNDYKGFYDGSQLDRAADEPEKQAASEAYGLESKELAEAWSKMGNGMKRIRNRIASPKFASDYKGGQALLALGGSKMGHLLPKLAKLERQGGRKGRSASEQARALPAMGGVSMSVVAQEEPELALEEEQDYQGRQQQMLAQWASRLPTTA